MDQKSTEACEQIILALLEKPELTEFELGKVKRAVAKKYHIFQPKNSQLLSVYHELIKEKRINPRPELARLLITRRVRSLSGVSVISVLTKPYPCPGRCLYCPEQKGVPKSYLRNEPAVMRAIDHQYDPYRQVASRIAALVSLGHPTDKLELIVIGGTWSYLPHDYQTDFIHRCFQAANQQPSQSLSEAHRINTQAKHRIIGLTLETRPDYINPAEIKRMRQLGATKVELGVQCLDDRILSLNQRGHGVKAVAQATRWLKDAGFKVGYHLMLNLPGASIEQEKSAAQLMFNDQRFRPDFLKIYPTAILPEAPLYRWWQEGRYKPYSRRELIELIKFIKERVPVYCRIQRVIRDIPSENVPVGPVKTTNLREIVLAEMKKEGRACRCIRCREIKENQSGEEPVLFRDDYSSAQGTEIFLSLENPQRDCLSALLRLRIPSGAFSQKNHFWPVLNRAALIRELHTYGRHLPLGEKDSLSAQHHGLGQKLIIEAEKITSQEFADRVDKIAVIAGIGTREYYRRFGYELEDTYMVKSLTRSKDA